MLFWWDFCPQKNYLSEAPDFSGLDPETLEPWSPKKVAKILGLQSFNSSEKIRTICEKILKENPKQVEIYQNGKTKIIGFFVKKIMDETKSGANPKIINDVLKELMAPSSNGSES